LLTIPASVIAGRTAKVPVVSTVRDYWHVCLYGTLWRVGSRGADGNGGICPICRGGELVLCLRQKYGAAAPLARPLLPLIEGELRRRQRALRESDSVVAVSHYVAGTLQGVVDSHKISVVPNLVDIQEIRRRAGVAPENVSYTPDHADSSSKHSQPPYLVFIGKLNELKGADLLPEIVRKANVHLKLIVVGDGPLAVTLAREPNFEVRGWLSNEDALCLLARSRALLFPSRWAEPLARVLLEAQALGTPTVALDTGGTRDIIDHEVNGLLARDTDEFAAQLTRLVNDPALSRSLSRTAQRIAEERFGDQVIARQMEQVYQKVQGSGRVWGGES
jgi:glycogen(starch) synthase